MLVAFFAQRANARGRGDIGSVLLRISEGALARARASIPTKA